MTLSVLAVPLLLSLLLWLLAWLETNTVAPVEVAARIRGILDQVDDPEEIEKQVDLLTAHPVQATWTSLNS